MNRVFAVSIDEEFEKSQVHRHTRRRKGRFQVVESYSRAELAGQKRHFKPGGRVTRAGRLDPKEKSSKIKIYTPEEIQLLERNYSDSERIAVNKNELKQKMLGSRQVPARGEWFAATHKRRRKPSSKVRNPNL